MFNGRFILKPCNRYKKKLPKDKPILQFKKKLPNIHVFEK